FPALFLLVLIAAYGGCSKAPEVTPPAPSEWRTFEGTWSASGDRHVLYLGPDHRTSVFNVAGSLLLKGPKGVGVGFLGKAIGFSDNLTGSMGRCVWTDEHGDEVFSELKGESVGTSRHLTGTITGGTGRYMGITGEYEFQWQFVVESEEGFIQGRTDNIKGRFRIGAPAAAGGAGQ
ncbi:MAG: hypothetical protein ACREVT_02520, partial [Burkholderiales bacterium]